MTYTARTKKWLITGIVALMGMGMMVPMTFSHQNYQELFSRCERASEFSLQLVCANPTDQEIVKQALSSLRTKLLEWEEKYPDHSEREVFLHNIQSHMYQTIINTPQEDEKFLLEVTDFYFTKFLKAYEQNSVLAR